MFLPIQTKIMNVYFFLSEIYRIVSQKQLPEGPSAGHRPGGGDPIHIEGTHSESSGSKKPCCNN